MQLVANELASTSDGPVAVVTAFYEALGRGDGLAAAQRVIPEKRARGPLSGNAMTRFYSQLAAPLQLVEVTQINNQTVLARYRYKPRSGTMCNGEALLTLRNDPVGTLIERIHALKGC
jgi:hypothetical protein